jgi:uncharacterized membrane protein YqiK
MPLLLLRLLPYILAAAALAAALYVVFDSGRKYERGIWAQRELEINTQLAKQQQDARQRIHKIEQDRQTELAGVHNEHLKNIAQLNGTITDLSSRGLYVTAAACPNDGMPDTGSSVNTKTTTAGYRTESKIRLSEEITSSLWDVVRAAEEVKELYLACRNIVTSSACSVRIVD